jgi:hypothetical protein
MISNGMDDVLVKLMNEPVRREETNMLELSATLDRLRLYRALSFRIFNATGATVSISAVKVPAGRLALATGSRPE